MWLYVCVFVYVYIFVYLITERLYDPTESYYFLTVCKYTPTENYFAFSQILFKTDDLLTLS